MPIHYKCPLCHQALFHTPSGFDCSNNHHFDQARQGYVNLMMNYHQNSGDHSTMIEARHHFLKQGYYQPLADALVDYLKPFKPKSMVDLGCGEGYYTDQLCAGLSLEEAFGFDLSKKAIQLASRHYKNCSFAIASIADVPCFDESFDITCNLFSTLYYEEMARITKPGGLVICVNSGVNHLYELKQALYEHVIPNTPIDFSNPWLDIIHQETIKSTITLNTQDLNALIDMTPYAYKTAKSDLTRVKQYPALTTDIEFSITVMKKNNT